MEQSIFTLQEIEALKTSRELRVNVATKSFKAFCAIYLSHLFELDFATFHKDIFNSLMSDQEFIAILGFRGSAKSTIVEAYALYGLVTQTDPFTVIIRDSIENSRKALGNIKSEIESNTRLRYDFNINLESKDKNTLTQKWAESQITIGSCTIMAVSRGQKVRGIKFENSRITKIIADDIENTENTKSSEMRKKTRDWFFSEVVPATAQGVLAEKVKVILIGNLVHRDCLLAYLENKEIVQVLKFAIRDENGNSTWKALYPDDEAINKQKERVMLAGKGMGNIIWAREYELKLIDEGDQIISESDIQYYTKDWLQKKIQRSGVGVDLAISKKETADYTAMVPALLVLNDYGEQRVLILPRVINERLNFQETVQKARTLYLNMVKPCKFRVEAVSYQQSAIEMLQKNGIDTVGVKPTGDKRARLMAISSYIKTGMVLFPEKGCEELITQLLGFGIEAHDDMVDALVYVIDGLLNEKQHVFGVC